MTNFQILTLYVCLLLASTQVLGHPTTDSRLAKVVRAILQEPKSQDHYIKKAQLLIELANLDAAKQALITARRLGNPANTDFVQALLLRKQGFNRNAIKTISAYIARHPKDHVALEIRAELHAQQQDYSPAIRDYRRLIANIAQPSPGHYLILADLLVKYSSDYQAALAVLDQGLKRLNAVSQLQRQAINYELQQKNYAAALKRLDSLKIYLGHTPEWLHENAHILELSGDRQQALDLYQQAHQQLLDHPKLSQRIKARQQLLVTLSKKIATLKPTLVVQ